MPTPAFLRNYAQILKAARQCLEQDLHMPALILVFTLIDSFAWAASEKADRNVRDRFEKWLLERIYPDNSLPCTPTELYAARCGILHTLTSQADLNLRQGVRQVVYAWGPAKLVNLQKSIEVLNRADLVGLHINELLDAIKEGMAKTFEAAEVDAALSARLQEAASLHLTEMPSNSLDKLMVLHEAGRKLL